MPKDFKKRGRRDAHKKRKREHQDDKVDTKRQKNHAADQIPENENVHYQDEAIDGVTRPGDMPFYGMLDEDEQEYFRKADEALELDQFEDAQARDLFLANVYKEATGKELKMANSQSCSRLMEKLILLSTPKQLKDLFQQFSGQ
jgi:nucleolar protein 9